MTNSKLRSVGLQLGLFKSANLKSLAGSKLTKALQIAESLAGKGSLNVETSAGQKALRQMSRDMFERNFKIPGAVTGGEVDWADALRRIAKAPKDLPLFRPVGSSMPFHEAAMYEQIPAHLTAEHGIVNRLLSGAGELNLRG